MCISDWSSDVCSSDLRAPGYQGVNYRAANSSTPDQSNYDIYTGTLTMNWSSPIGEIASITAYKDLSTDEFTDQDGTIFFLQDTQRTVDQWQFTQELRDTIKPSDDTELLVGAFYMKQNYFLLQNHRREVFAPGTRQLQTEDQDDESLPTFGQFSWTLTDRLRFHRGIRKDGGEGKRV